MGLNNSTALHISSGQNPWTALRQAVLDTLHSEHSRRAYGRGLDSFFAWFQQTQPPAGFCKATVSAYGQHLVMSGLQPASVAVRLTAVRRLAAELADAGAVDMSVALAIGKVKAPKQLGTKIGNWLTVQQAEAILSAPDASSLKGKRDRAILAVMVGCGLRRTEVAALRFDHVQQRDGRWCIVDLTGKGGRVRTIPMPAWAKVAVDAWDAAADLGGVGRVVRPLNHGRLSGDDMDPHNIWQAIRLYGSRIGVPKLAPHDLRRTFAKLAHKGKAGIEQIQISLGHSSIQTTERYLGITQDLQNAPCDHLGVCVGSAL